MAISIKNIIPAKQAEAIGTTQYTSTNCITIIDKFTATNTGAVNASLSVWLISASGTAGDSNLVMDARELAPGETYTCPEVVGHSLDIGAKIGTLASIATTITIMASGRQITA
jgi:hypothetical protein